MTTEYSPAMLEYADKLLDIVQRAIGPIQSDLGLIEQRELLAHFLQQEGLPKDEASLALTELDEAVLAAKADRARQVAAADKLLRKRLVELGVEI